MGNLRADTEVSGGDGHYRAKISPDWDFWVPNGGYISAVALRAAGAETDLPRPAAYYCHYLNPATSGQEAELVVTTLRKSKRTHSMRVEMSQEGKPVLEALVWALITPGGFDYNHAVMPEVPAPDELKSFTEIHPDEKPPFEFWNHVDGKPITWTGRWEDRPPMHPLWRGWYRFTDVATFADPFEDACRSLVLMDTMLYPAAAMTHEASKPFMAPSMDLTVRFHTPATTSEWLMASTEVPVGVDGLVGGYAAVWSEDGVLLATGGQQMLYRAMPT